MPFFIVYYLFYTAFPYNDPEGRVTDTTVSSKYFIASALMTKRDGWLLRTQGLKISR